MADFIHLADHCQTSSRLTCFFLNETQLHFKIDKISREDKRMPIWQQRFHQPITGACACNLLSAVSTSLRTAADVVVLQAANMYGGVDNRSERRHAAVAVARLMMTIRVRRRRGDGDNRPLIERRQTVIDCPATATQPRRQRPTALSTPQRTPIDVARTSACLPSFVRPSVRPSVSVFVSTSLIL